MRTEDIRRITRMLIVMTLSIALLLILIVWIRWLGLEDLSLSLLNYTEETGMIGQLIVILLGAVFVLALLPSVMLTLAAGFLYGPIHGSVLIVVGETIGALISFSIVRTGKVQRWTQKFRNSDLVNYINLIMQTSSWQLVASIRMIPMFPFKLSNYVFGLTNVRVQHYIIGTLVGLWPITLFNTYIGSLSGDLLSLGQSQADRTVGDWTVIIVGFILVVIFMIYTTLRSQRLLRKQQG